MTVNSFLEGLALRSAIRSTNVKNKFFTLDNMKRANRILSSHNKNLMKLRIELVGRCRELIDVDKSLRVA